MKKAIFMSIKEIHVNKILKRIKNYEFRTQKPKNNFEYIIVYVPVPIKQIKYILKVKQPIVTPNKIQENGIGNREFNKEIKKKYAYFIENVYEINKPLNLENLKKDFNFTAPQSFAYGEKYEELLNYIENIGAKKIF